MRSKEYLLCGRKRIRVGTCALVIAMISGQYGWRLTVVGGAQTSHYLGRGLIEPTLVRHTRGPRPATAAAAAAALLRLRRLALSAYC